MAVTLKNEKTLCISSFVQVTEELDNANRWLVLQTEAS
jgi:hypothetical protein